MSKFLSIAEIEAEISRLEKKAVETGWAIRQPDRYKKFLANIKAARASKTTFECPDCAQKTKYYALTFGQYYNENNVPVPARCECCEWEIEYRKQIEANLKRFRAENPGWNYYCKKSSGKPPRPEQYKAVMEWQCVGPASLVLMGDSFTGKTTAIYHKVWSMIESGDIKNAKILTETDLNDIPDRCRDGTIRQYMNELLDIDVVVLDDLDKANVTPRVASEINGLIETRLRILGCPVFITLNIKTEFDFVRLFSKKEIDGIDPRKRGQALYNRIQQVSTFIDFDEGAPPSDSYEER